MIQYPSSKNCKLENLGDIIDLDDDHGIDATVLQTQVCSYVCTIQKLSIVLSSPVR